MADETPTKNFTTLITVAATAVGLLAGSTGMWFTLRDRIEKQVETRVTRDVKIETRLARLEERFEALKSEVWTQRTTTTPNAIPSP